MAAKRIFFLINLYAPKAVRPDSMITTKIPVRLGSMTKISPKRANVLSIGLEALTTKDEGRRRKDVPVPLPSSFISRLTLSIKRADRSAVTRDPLVAERFADKMLDPLTAKAFKLVPSLV